MVNKLSDPMCWSIATTKLPTKITFKPQFAVFTFSFLAEFSAKIWFRMMKPSSGFVHNTIYMLVLKHCKDHWIPFSIYKTYASCMQRAKMYSMGKKSLKQANRIETKTFYKWLDGALPLFSRLSFSLFHCILCAALYTFPNVLFK